MMTSRPPHGRRAACWLGVRVLAGLLPLLAQRAGGQVVAPPSVRIAQPAASAVFALGAPITLRAAAADGAGTDLSGAVVWASDVDGLLGTGTGLETVLSAGIHVVRASVTDAGGRTASDQVTIGVVIPANGTDTPPLVTITAPAPAGTIAAGPPVVFAASASDLEDGLVSDALVWTSDRDGALGTGATFTRALSQGIHRITARVTDSGGAAGSASVVIQVGPPVTLTFTAAADASVDAAQPTNALGAAPILRVDTNTARHSYLRFVVSGIGGRAVTHAFLRLQVDAGEAAGSARGGSVYALAGGLWDERTVTYANRPAVSGPAIASVGPVVRGQVVDFDVSAAISGDGTYDLALIADSDDEVTYRSKEGGPAPRLILTLSGHPPVVTISQPDPATTVRLGDPVSLRAHAVDLEDGDLDASIDWISSHDGLLGTGPDVLTTALGVGTHTISATAMDTDGAVGSAEVQLTVLPPTGSGPPPTTPPTNTAPVISIAAPASNDVLLAHHAVVLNATAFDAEDGDLGAMVRWISNRDGVLGTGATLVVPGLSEGGHILTATVTDRTGAPAAATIMVTVVPDTLFIPDLADTYVDAGAPTTPFGTASALLAGIAPSSRQAFLRFAVAGLGRFTVQHATLRLTAAAASPSGGTLIQTSDVSWSEASTTYATRPTIDGRALRSQGAVAAGQVVDFDVTRAIAGDGDYGFALVSTAGDGVRYLSREAGTGGPQLILTLGQSSAPVVTIRSPAADSAVDGDVPVALAATATDGRGADASARLQWTSSLDGALGSGALVTVPHLSPGTHLITATVTDAQGLRGEARIALLVRRPNRPPAVTILSPIPSISIRPDTPVRLAALVSDDNDRDIGARLSWTSSRDGALGTGPSVTVMLSPGAHTIAATAVDSGGRSGSAQVVIRVSIKPTVTIAAPTNGASALPGSLVSLSGTAHDDDDGDLSARIAWSSDLDGPLGTGAVIRLGTLRLGRHTITASVTDNSGLQAIARVGLLVNTPPTIAITAPVPYWRFVPGDAVALAAVASDREDGDLGSRIVWSSDLDGPLGTGAATTLTTLSLGTHTLTATVADSAGTIVRASVVLAPFGCLTQAGPLVTLTGISSNAYLNWSLAAATRIDVRTASFLASPSNRYPVNLKGNAGVCVGGGVVLGQYDRTLTWAQMHYDNNNAAVAFDDASLTVDGMRIDDVTDGIRPQSGDDFVIRGTRMSYVRDDCVENDHMLAGLVDDSLLDGCYVAFSSRPSQSIIDSGYDGHAKLWTIRNTLVRLQPMPGPNGPSADGLGHGGFFKWHNWDNPATSLSPKLALYNNVFMAERAGDINADRMGIPPGQLQDCANNVVVWLGAGPFPATLPACFTVTTDRGVWDRAVADWERRHPQVPR